MLLVIMNLHVLGQAVRGLQIEASHLVDGNIPMAMHGRFCTAVKS